MHTRIRDAERAHKALFTKILGFAIAGGFVLFTAGPVNAVSRNESVDCSTVFTAENNNHDFTHILPNNESATIVLQNCDGFGFANGGDLSLTGTVTIGGTGSTNSWQTISGNNVSLVADGTRTIGLHRHDGSNDYWFYLYFIEAGNVIPEPSGSELDPVSFTVPQNPVSFTIGTPKQIMRFNSLKFSSGCDIFAGTHIAVTKTFTVDRAGEYSFNTSYVGVTDPNLEISGVFHPAQDLMFSVYKKFSPKKPLAKSLACNDDIGSVVGLWPVELFGGHVVSDKSPAITVQLKPGTYTLLSTTNWPVSGVDWGAGSSRNMQETWTPQTVDVTLQVYGPIGSTVIFN